MLIMMCIHSFIHRRGAGGSERWECFPFNHQTHAICDLELSALHRCQGKKRVINPTCMPLGSLLPTSSDGPPVPPLLLRRHTLTHTQVSHNEDDHLIVESQECSINGLEQVLGSSFASSLKVEVRGKLKAIPGKQVVLRIA